LTHSSNFSTAFYHIFLVDANGVYPEVEIELELFQKNISELLEH